MKQEKFKLAVLRDYSGDLEKRWCVYYYVEGIRKRIWISKKLTSRPERYKEADKIIKDVNTKLRQGIFNFDLTENDKLPQLLQRVYDYKAMQVKPRSLKSFEFIISDLKKWLKQNQLETIYIDDFTNVQANKFVDDILVKKNSAASTFNAKIGYLKSIFNRIEEISSHKNPFARIKPMKITETMVNIWDAKSKKKFSDYTQLHDPGMFLYALFIYHLYARPTEIRFIKIEDINFQSGTLRIKSTIAKNRKIKYVTLSQQILKILKTYKKFPKDWYIFSYSMVPGPNNINLYYANKRFKKYRKKIKIPDHLKLYNFKHTGNSEMLEKGLNIHQLKQQNRHSSIVMTEIYLSKLRAIADPDFLNMSGRL